MFLFVLFEISVNIRLILVPDLSPKTYCKLRLNCIRRYIFRVLLKLDQAEELEHVTDWSGIWHDFDVVYCMHKKKKREYLGYAVEIKREP